MAIPRSDTRLLVSDRLHPGHAMATTGLEAVSKGLGDGESRSNKIVQGGTPSRTGCWVVPKVRGRRRRACVASQYPHIRRAYDARGIFLRHVARVDSTAGGIDY